MTRTCCIKNCNYSIQKGVSTFSFPNKVKFPNCFKIWLDFSNLHSCDIDKTIAICENHFATHCFNIGKRKTLKQGAVPTIFGETVAKMHSFSNQNDILIKIKHEKVTSDVIIEF